MKFTYLQLIMLALPCLFVGKGQTMSSPEATTKEKTINTATIANTTTNTTATIENEKANSTATIVNEATNTTATISHETTNTTATTANATTNTTATANETTNKTATTANETTNKTANEAASKAENKPSNFTSTSGNTAGITCPPNSEYSCNKTCFGSCEDLKDPDFKCNSTCRCTCREGYVFNSTSSLVCVSLTECDCGNLRHFESCAPEQPVTCDNLKPPATGCKPMCVCDSGYMFTAFKPRDCVPSGECFGRVD